MSFILDALKKSETERQRQSGPGLFQLKVAVPKAPWPAWAFALGALLAVNIGVVGWLMLRQPSRAAVVEATPAQTPTPVVQAPPPANAPPANTAPPQASPADVAPLVETEAAPVAADAPAQDDLNPDDYQPAVEAAGSALPAEAHAKRGTAEGLPTYEEVAGNPSSGLPELRLDLHVFAAKPQERFIMLNMHRLREGDSLPEGVRVEKITADGVVLSFRNTKFVYERE